MAAPQQRRALLNKLRGNEIFITRRNFKSNQKTGPLFPARVLRGIWCHKHLRQLTMQAQRIGARDATIAAALSRRSPTLAVGRLLRLCWRASLLGIVVSSHTHAPSGEPQTDSENE
jgi:hypothetical protein